MRLRIVVVDDSAIFLKMFISVLETEFDVVAAIMNRMSIRVIRGCQPDVVVLDLEMPGLNGDRTHQGIGEMQSEAGHCALLCGKSTQKSLKLPGRLVP